jgi:hypothetical protein
MDIMTKITIGKGKINTSTKAFPVKNLITISGIQENNFIFVEYKTRVHPLYFYVFFFLTFLFIYLCDSYFLLFFFFLQNCSFF